MLTMDNKTKPWYQGSDRTTNNMEDLGDHNIYNIFQISSKRSDNLCEVIRNNTIHDREQRESEHDYTQGLQARAKQSF